MDKAYEALRRHGWEITPLFVKKPVIHAEKHQVIPTLVFEGNYYSNQYITYVTSPTWIIKFKMERTGQGKELFREIKWFLQSSPQ